MGDLARFRLKSADELVKLIDGRDNFFIVACNKCFREFSFKPEPECGELLQLLHQHGKTVAGQICVDFLCNKTQTGKMLGGLEIPDSGCLLVASCGLGGQTVAGLSAFPVLVACDSVNAVCAGGGGSGASGDGAGGSEGANGLGSDAAITEEPCRSEGFHGMSLSAKRCGACGQCYLNMTGGICPVTDCSKSLINGPCGGSRKGKCETDASKDCAWVRIIDRLQTGGEIEQLSGQPVQLRDYSKINSRTIGEYVRSIRDKRLDGYYGGVHPAERKEFCEDLAIVRFPAPQTVTIPLLQHIGAPALPIVKEGDYVKTGQKIGEAAGYVSCPVHASLSGTVVSVGLSPHPNTGLDVMCVTIESDNTDELHESVKPCDNPGSLTADEIIAIIRDKGLTGMGGAGFPTAVKVKSPKPIDTVLINGCECEPLLTADHRLMLEYSGHVAEGLSLLLRATGAGAGIIVIEDNKPNAIAAMEACVKDLDNISVLPVRTKYPQGAEKMLIKRALGRHVPSGALPLDVGVAVCNAGTAKAVSDAVLRGMPLIERVVTVSGERIQNPGNFLVRFGTPVKSILDYCGTKPAGYCADCVDSADSAESDGMGCPEAGCSGTGDYTIMLGGPMMGVEVRDLNVPVIKGTNGIIAIEPAVTQASNCIRCGRCVDVCPMELFPLYFPQYLSKDFRGDVAEAMKDKAVADCVECGCCDFVCPSKIKIRDAIRIGKKHKG